MKYGIPEWLEIPHMRADPRIEVCNYADTWSTIYMVLHTKEQSIFVERQGIIVR